LQIDNRSNRAQWLLVSALDPDYYPPGEAAALFGKGYSDATKVKIDRHVERLTMPLKTSAGSVSEGHVITPRHEGGRYLIVKLLSGEGLLEFGFPVKLPDGDFDFESLEVSRIYEGRELPDLAEDALRRELRGLPCCVTNEDSDRMGDPLNLVLVGEPDHLLGRKQDVALQRARSTIVQRNHLRLWMAPFRCEGRPVWVGQVNLTEDPYFTDGHRVLIILAPEGIVPPEDVQFLEWQNSRDPLARPGTRR